MTPSNRVIVNTGAQYIRTVINVLLALYATRLILKSLGADDYGIYTLIAGVVAMLSFLTNALVITTQRYMSFHQARGETEKQKQIFNNSLILHAILSLLLIAALEIAGLFLFDGFLNIAPDPRHRRGEDRLPVHDSHAMLRVHGSTVSSIADFT